MKRYAVKEVFGSFQGEGLRSGRPCVFVRFSGCNAWDGKEETRAKRGGCALCCDTDFVGTDGINGGRHTVDWLLEAAAFEWGIRPKLRHTGMYVVFTGGEPALQLDEALVLRFKRDGWETAVETNGSLPLPDGIDWVTVSPKPPLPVVVERADEVKCLLPYPGEALHPLDYAGLSRNLFVQPVAGSRMETLVSMAECIRFALDNPGWRVSFQLHKMMGTP